MITLVEFLQAAASGEQIEIIDIENQECGSPEQIDNWHEYTVKHFYSLFNPATKETYTQVEVKRCLTTD